jgi:diguanylate cyclase (GGDEF)-like protein/PAS domain S-box-containing protein
MDRRTDDRIAVVGHEETVCHEVVDILRGAGLQAAIRLLDHASLRLPQDVDVVIEANMKEFLESTGPKTCQIIVLTDSPASCTDSGSRPIYWLPYPPKPDELVRTVREALTRASTQHDLVDDRERYRRLVDRMAAGVVELRGGRITYVNEYVLALSKYTPPELIGHPPEDFVHPQDRSALLRSLAEGSGSPSAEHARVYRLIAKDGSEITTETTAYRIGPDGSDHLEITLRDITKETRLTRLHRVVLELGEVILAEVDIDRILQLVLDTITEYSGFRRAVLTLYDLSIPVPFDGAAYKTLCSGLTVEERAAVLKGVPLDPSERRQVFDDRFRLGPAYYIPHDQVPWAQDLGIAGNVTIDGWNKDDYLFIPLRGSAGIIGSISVDDPIDQNAPTLASIEPVASLASFAALAVERAYKLHQLNRQQERMHSLRGFGAELSDVENVESLCERAARRVCDGMEHDFCAVWLREGADLVLQGYASRVGFPQDEMPARGARAPIAGDGVTRWAIRYAEPVLVQDAPADPRYLRSRSSIQSMAAIPILGAKGVLGALDVESQRLAAFGEQDLESLSTLASQLAIAIAALRRRDSLTRIYGLGQRIASASSVEGIVAGALDFLAEQFDYQLSAVFLKNPDGQLSIAGIRGPYAPQGIAQGWPLPQGEGIVGWVGRNRRSALVADVKSDPRYLQALPDTSSELAVPLLHADKLLGVLNVESPLPQYFDDEDRRLLEVIASHIATALANLDSQQTLREQAIRDPLTGLFNRHYFNSIIAPELSRSDRYTHPFTVMMLDVDGFRAVNNRLGHLKGDEVLQRVASLLLENVRTSDRVIRYGGDEFLVFMPETDEEVDAVADRLRAAVARVPRHAGCADLPIGLSIGIYTRLPGERRSAESILEEVDRRMYADKRARNMDRADDYRA